MAVQSILASLPSPIPISPKILLLTKDFSSTLGRDAQVQQKLGGFQGLAASVRRKNVSSGMFDGGGSVKSSQRNVVTSDADLK